MATKPVEVQANPPERRAPNKHLLVLVSVGLIAILSILVLSLNGGNGAVIATGNANVLVLAIPAFLAGVLSFLSPCTLPILPAYFAFTFQARKQSIVLMSISFFLGLATTMTLLGASATALSGLLFQNKDVLTFWGGMIVVGFGVLSILGKGFAGPQLQERPVASIAGSYLYGATFALGWTACVGPILGALLTLLATTAGVAILQGAILAFIYALGLGMPLILLATFFSRLGQGSAFWKFLRGRGFEVKIGAQTLYLHTTSILSGVLMIVMGALLASGQLEVLTQFANGTSFSQWWVGLESEIGRLFGLQ
ncbi:MAG: cytochrome c biogenesis CcdA family protein [Chloroflexales bacterium]|nr:cytochrome c biogenesis CcdA family protein [Chloroflexales bacterium]